MSATLQIKLTPEAQETLRVVQTLPQNVLLGIARAMDLQNQYTISHIVRDYLSFPKGGPAVPIGLRVQSGRGRASVRASKAVVRGQQVQSGIGSNVVYMGVHEFGFEGSQSVSAHTRHVASRDVYAFKEEKFKFRKPRKWKQLSVSELREEEEAQRASFHSDLLQRTALGQRQKIKTASGAAFVRAFERHVNFPARAPIQRGIEDTADAYGKAISVEVQKVWEGKQ